MRVEEKKGLQRAESRRAVVLAGGDEGAVSIPE